MYRTTSDVGFDRVMLEKFKYAINYHIDQEDFMAPNIDVEQTINFITNQVVLTFRADIVGQKLEDFKYPADWFQAFKERWFPKWLLDKFPVKYKVLEVKALYPQLHVPPEVHNPIIHVMRKSEVREW